MLSPGWTSYRDRLVHETVDVTALVREGENVLGATIAGAWYTEKYGFFDFADRLYGTQPSFLAQLRVTYADGAVETLAATGDGWQAFGDGPSSTAASTPASTRTCASPCPAGRCRLRLQRRRCHERRSRCRRFVLRRSHLLRRLTPSGRRRAWARPRSPATRTSRCPRRGSRRRCAASSPSPSPTRSRHPRAARILDFGQNLVGRLRVRVRGEAGQRVVIRHAEVLEEGELGIRPLRNATATATFDLAGGDEILECRFSFYGFRYAEITGADIDPADIEAVVLHTDMTRTGWFAASDPMLDRLHENVVWGMRGNFLSIPTDCPQRDERLGWTGDIQVFSPTASFLYDCDGFLTSWLRDLAHEQARNDGEVPLVIPAALPSFGGIGPTAAWGDAATAVPDRAARALRRPRRARGAVRRACATGQTPCFGMPDTTVRGPAACSSATGSTPPLRPTSPARPRSTATSSRRRTSPSRSARSPTPPRCSASRMMPRRTRLSPSAVAPRSCRTT